MNTIVLRAAMSTTSAVRPAVDVNSAASARTGSGGTILVYLLIVLVILAALGYAARGLRTLVEEFLLLAGPLVRVIITLGIALAVTIPALLARH